MPVKIDSSADLYRKLPSVDELQNYVKSEIGHWGDLVRKIGIAGTE